MRAPHRENLFKWVGPIFQINIRFLSKTISNITINDIKELNDLKYKVGVIREDIAHQMLINLGVSEKVLVANAKPSELIRLISINKIDLIARDVTTFFWELKQNGLSEDDYTVIHYDFDKKTDPAYFAFNKNTSDKIINNFQNTLDAIKADGTYKTIVNRYIK